MISLVVALVILALLYTVVETMLPIDSSYKRILHIVFILIFLLYVLRVFGLL